MNPIDIVIEVVACAVKIIRKIRSKKKLNRTGQGFNSSVLQFFQKGF